MRKKTAAQRDAASKAKCVKLLMENAQLRKQLNCLAGCTTAPTKKEKAFRKEAYNAMVDTFYKMLPYLKEDLLWHEISLPNAKDKDWLLPKWL